VAKRYGWRAHAEVKKLLAWPEMVLPAGIEGKLKEFRTAWVGAAAAALMIVASHSTGGNSLLPVQPATAMV